MSQHILLGNMNQPVLSWMISHRDPNITNIMQFCTTFANPSILTAIVCLSASILAVRNREIQRPILLIIATGSAATISTILKIITMNARPPQTNMIPPIMTSYSFPSGHTISMMTFLLILGYLLCSRNSSRRHIIVWVTTAIIGTGIIAVSRIYLGYHWLTDVMASIGLSFVILATTIIIDRLINLHNKNQPELLRL